METKFYPNDKKVRDWIAVAMVIAEAVWKHIEEWKEDYIGSALPEMKAKTEAHTRGIQNASFLFLDVLEDGEMSCDEVMNAVTVFYLAANQTVSFLEEQGKGKWEPAGLAATAENLLEVTREWYDAIGAKPVAKKAA